MISVRTLFILKFGRGGRFGRIDYVRYVYVWSFSRLWNCENADIDCENGAIMLKYFRKENDILAMNDFELIVSQLTLNIYSFYRLCF